ncbi:PGAM-domain-containing protein [Armillaria solidipes]|uniref:PGAM-domain-containing protein n=1 Tax=Armillaria solidipes TaxID=1076256 RepID=A0A2H3BZS9_9AGAR|nr:PGAM-domain-containing protein [Armillaria solidipes]
MDSPEELSNSAASAPAIVEDTSNRSKNPANPGKCLILTLARHGQAESNVGSCNSSDRYDPLTDSGRCQAERLGKELSSTHIDHLASSPYLRALDTASAIGRNNIERPDLKPEEDELIIEQDHGPQVDAARRSGNESLEYQLRTGQRAFRCPTSSTSLRSYSPPGGESLDRVSSRAKMALRSYLRSYGASFASMPDVSVDLADLIDGVPHVVVVSHNIFLIEFYEAMLFFNNPSQRYNTPVQWRTAGWGRYIVFYDGARLEIQTMKKPC